MLVMQANFLGLEGRKGTYQVRQNGTTQEDHVSPSRRVFDADLEFLYRHMISIRYAGQCWGW